MRAALAALLLAAACRAPKYAAFVSEEGDFSLEAPRGWNVYAQKGDDSRAYTFAGPFDPDFYLGVPTLSVRRHAAGSAEQYVDGMLREVYGLSEVPRRRVEVAGRRAWNFEAASAVEAPPGRLYGVSERAGRTYNDRRHAYVVLPMERGFYVIVYPATAAGYPKHLARFNHLVNTFRLSGP